MLEVRCFDQIHAVPETEWDSIIQSGDVFHTHRFLRSLEDGQVENALFRYVMFYRAGRVVASAVLSIFTIQLDLLVPSHPVTRWIKRLRPRFFQLRVCLCGSPVSIGQRHLVLTPDVGFEEVLPLLHGEIRRFAGENGVRHYIFKEFFEEDMRAMAPVLAREGFFIGYTLPYLKLPIRWNSFEDYLESMRSSFRRQARASLKKIQAAPDNPDAPHLTLLSPEQCPPELFHELYQSVMGRAAVRLETLNEAFFRHFYRNMAADMRIYGLVQGDKVLCAAMLVAHGEELTFVWAGKPQARDDAYNDYFNLLTGMVMQAVEGRYRVLNFGQVAFYTKQRLGGHPHHLYLFYRAESAFWHRLLNWGRLEIFPKVDLKDLKVFR